MTSNQDLKKGAVLNTANMAFPFFGGNTLSSFCDNFPKEELKNDDLNAPVN